MKNSLPSALFLVAMLVAMLFGYRAYQENRATDAVRPAVKLASLYATRFLELEITAGNLTLQDYAQRADNAVAELEKKVLEVKSLSTAEHQKIFDHAVRHIETTQALIQEFANGAHHLAQAGVAEERAQRLWTIMQKSPDRHEVNFARKAVDVAVEDLKEEAERFRQSRQALYALLQAMHASLPALHRQFGAHAAPDQEKLLQVRQELEAKNLVARVKN